MRELLTDYIASLQDRISDLANLSFPSYDEKIEIEILQDVVEELIEILYK